MLLDTIERCYFGFRRRRRDVRQATSCECNACVRIPDLDLKFVVHHGAAILQKVAGPPGAPRVGRDRRAPAAEERGRREAGHRRLRPHQPAVHRCHPTSTRPRSACASTPRRYDRIGEVPVWVHDLERRWQEEEARGRVFVIAGGVHPRSCRCRRSVPPQVAWEFLTKPGQRMTWQPWVTEVTVKGATGGRRGPGSSQPLHARQGRRHRGDPRLAPVRLRHRSDDPRHAQRTGEGAPHHRVRAGRLGHRRSTSGSPRRRPSARRRSWSTSDRHTGRRCESGIPSLIAQLDAELAARETDRGPEPELPRPSPDGPLSGLQPLVIVD